MVEDPRPIERQTPAKSFTVSGIETSDVLEVLAKGLRDFRQAPSYGLVFGCIYGIGGWLLLALLLLLDLPLLDYPLAAGFAIIAPFIAYAFYCVSDCLERDASLTWGRVGRTWPSGPLPTCWSEVPLLVCGRVPRAYGLGFEPTGSNVLPALRRWAH